MRRPLMKKERAVRLARVWSAQSVRLEKKIQVKKRLCATPDRRTGGNPLERVGRRVIVHIEIVVHGIKRRWCRCPDEQRPSQQESEAPSHDATVCSP